MLNYCLARRVPRVFFSPVRPPSAGVRSFTCVRVRSLKSHNTSASVLVRACTPESVPIRVRSCMYVCVRAHTSAFVPLRLRSCVCVCVHIIKSPDASARIISDASGRVFRSRTFEVYYTCTCTYFLTVCKRYIRRIRDRCTIIDNHQPSRGNIRIQEPMTAMRERSRRKQRSAGIRKH